MNVANIALSGLNAAALQLANSANNIANMNTLGKLEDGKPVGGYTPTNITQSAIDPLGGVRATVTSRDPAAVVSVVGGEEMTAPNVSLEEEVVNQDIATYTFTANLKSLKAYDEMIGTVIDMTA